MTGLSQRGTSDSDESVDATMEYVGERAVPPYDEDDMAPADRSTNGVLVRLQGGPHNGEVTICLPGCDLLFPDGAMYRYSQGGATVA